MGIVRVGQGEGCLVAERFPEIVPFAGEGFVGCVALLRISN